jgi:predicted LPLAT superfamily acyltransferase
MTTLSARQKWLQKPERSNRVMLRILVWVALRLGRTTARILLYPICAYFLLFAPTSTAASRRFLRHVLGRAPGISDLYRHVFFFAACLLDRIFLLNEQSALFDARIHGETDLRVLLARGKGSVLIGAHVGSFEIIRALGRKQPDLKMSLLMYQNNARMLAGVVEATNPALTMEIISLGRKDAMLKVHARLEEGALIGMLGDRTLEGEEQEMCRFFGKDAAFPLGPFRLAKILRRPVILMLGLYRGGVRYDVHFEELADWSDERETMTIKDALNRYVERLEYHVRRSPYNWFNFYDFWK